MRRRITQEYRLAQKVARMRHECGIEVTPDQVIAQAIKMAELALLTILQMMECLVEEEEMWAERIREMENQAAWRYRE